MFKPRIIICVPSGVTEVEERAVIDAALQAGASRAYLIEEPIAAAIGVGIDIGKPCGCMIVDMGGGTTDIAVISLGSIVVSRSIKVAGDKFDEAIVRYIRKKYNVLIGERTAEEMKVTIGCVFPKPEHESMEVRGRSLVTGLPQTITVTGAEMLEAFDETANQIVDAVKFVLEKTPPELVCDISASGMIMTGGGAMIWGMDKLLEQETGISCTVVESAVERVVMGTGKALENIAMLQSNSVATRKQ